MRLLQILGSGMSTKVWEAAVDHAKTCVLDKREYAYFPRSHVKNGVVFNVVGQVTGLLRDGQYVHFDKLSELEKVGSQHPATFIFISHFILSFIYLLNLRYYSNIS